MVSNPKWEQNKTFWNPQLGLIPHVIGSTDSRDRAEAKSIHIIFMWQIALIVLCWLIFNCVEHSRLKEKLLMCILTTFHYKSEYGLSYSILLHINFCWNLAIPFSNEN